MNAVGGLLEPGPGAAAYAVRRRISVSFAPDGRGAAALAESGNGVLAAESCSWEGSLARFALLAGGEPETHRTQVVPAGRGRIVALRMGAGVHRVVLLSGGRQLADGSAVDSSRLDHSGLDESVFDESAFGVPVFDVPVRGGAVAGDAAAAGAGAGAGSVAGAERELAVMQSRAARLLPSPDPAVDAVLLTADGSATRIWRVVADAARPLRLVLEVPGLLGGGVWLDAEGGSLAVQWQRRQDAAAVPAVADLRAGRIAPDPYVASTGDGGAPGNASGGAAMVWAAHPGSGLRLVARPGARWPLSLAGPGRSERAPAALNGFEDAVAPLGFSPDGRALALHARAGVRSRIYVFDVGGESVRELAIPAGSVTSAGVWCADGLRFAFGAPGAAAGLATLGPDGAWRVDGARLEGAGAPGSDARGSDSQGPAVRAAGVRGVGARLVAAHAQDVPGAVGPIESVVYGGAGWRSAPRLVVALHGGPSDQWSLVHHPLFAQMAAHGCGVLAPNQRGSTGYGRAHREAIVGGWAVADLDDVLRIGGDLAAARQAAGLARPVLFGVSYGAFLAMVALAARPGLWGGCVAVAPFLSAAALYRDASPPVRAMLARLRACEPAGDALGPRDLEVLFAPARGEAERPPVYLLHGARDEVIPVAHTRRLAAVLGAAGWRQGRELFVRELPDAGHDPFDGAPGAADSAASVVRFVCSGRP